MCAKKTMILPGVQVCFAPKGGWWQQKRGNQKIIVTNCHELSRLVRTISECALHALYADIYFWGSAQHIFRLPLHQSKRFGWINQFLDRQKEREYSHQKYGWNRIRRSAGKAGCCLFGKTARWGESWTCPAHPERHQVGGVNAGTLPKIAGPTGKNCRTHWKKLQHPP